MTDSLFAELDRLARDGAHPPLDLAGLHARAGRVRRRHRAAAAAAALAAVGVVGIAVAVVQPQDRPETLVPGIVEKPASAAPSRERLEQVLTEVLGATGPVRAQDAPAGPLGPDRSAFGAPGRLIAVDSLYALGVPLDGQLGTLDAHWYVVSPPLAADEADLLGRGIFRDGPRPDPPAVPMTGNPNGRTDGLQSLVHFLAGAGDNPGRAGAGEILVIAWETSGGIAQLRATGTPGDEDLAARLDRAAQALLRPNGSG